MAKESYVGIDNVARKVKSLYIGVDGVARKVKKAYIGVDGIAREWYSSGKKLSSCAVGDIVQLPENGTNVEYIVVHQGLPSSMYDESCNGTWLMRKGIYNNTAWDNTYDNDYANSYIHSYMNNDFYGVLGSNVQSAVKQVKIPYRKGAGTSKTVTSGENGLSTKVFLLSMREVNFTDSNSPVEGATLSYFSNATNSERIAYLDGTATMWWLRSPQTINGNTRVWSVSETGAKYSNHYVYNNYGLRPAFIMDGDTLIDPETNTIL